MSDSFRNEKGQFISGAPWQYKNGHPQSNFIQIDKNKLCWEMMNWLMENIQEPELFENDFNHDIVQIWYMIMNFGYSHSAQENPENDSRIIKFFSYIQGFMPESMRNREMYKYRQTDKVLTETFENWFFECKQKLQNYLTQQYFAKGRMKDLEILKRRYKENWSEQKIVDAKVDAQEQIDGNITINIKDA